MIRSLTFLVPDPAWIRNPTNSPLATMGARMAAASRTATLIASVQAALSRHCGPPPLRAVTGLDGLLTGNHWTVRLTRIAPGHLDPLTGGASMKAVQDAVARWCGEPHEQKPIWTWVEPIGQEKRGKGVYGVRIEIEDLQPGQRSPVVLQQIEIVKPPKKAKKAKKVRDHAPGAPHDCKAVGCSPEWMALHARWGGKNVVRTREALGPGGDDEKSPRQLKPCPRAGCWAALDLPCKLLPGDLVVCGVHAERAQAAGVEGIALPHPRPSEAKGPRRDVPSGPRPVPVFVVLPWRTKGCELCGGSGGDIIDNGLDIPYDAVCAACRGYGVVPREPLLEPRVDGRSAPRCLRYRVPGEHVARWGSEVVLWPAREPVGGVDAVVFRERKRG